MTLTFTNGNITTSASEQTVLDITSDAIHMFWLFTHNMTASETVVIKVSVRDVNGAATRIWESETLTGAQSEPAYYVPPLATTRLVVTIQRTAGSDRLFTWMRAEVT